MRCEALDRADRSILITGGGGFIGTALSIRLAARTDVQRVVAVDIRFNDDLGNRQAKLDKVEREIACGIDDLIADREIDTVIHAAFLIAPHRDEEFARSINVNATLRLLDACGRLGVRHFVYLSSATVYGAHADNPDRHSETDQIRPNDFQYALHKREAERMIQTKSEEFSSLNTCVLRAAIVLGAGAGNFVAETLKRNIAIAPRRANPRVQFTHIDDFVEAVERVLSLGASGTYNIAGTDTIDWHRAMELLRIKRIDLPDWLLYPLVGISWSLGLQNKSQPAALDLVRFPYEVSTDKARSELNWEPKMSSEAAIKSFVEG